MKIRDERMINLYFPPKIYDFWPIERVWEILAPQVYRNPHPTHISGVIYRVHGMPAKLQEIYRLKGTKIQSSWKAKNRKYACRC